jgi:hypothetical protein
MKPPYAGNGGPADPLEESFPLGDGRAQDTAEVVCPYCCEPVLIHLDPGSGSRQRYVEDCAVCCRPWQVRVRYASDGSAEVTLAAEDDG